MGPKGPRAHSGGVATDLLEFFREQSGGIFVRQCFCVRVVGLRDARVVWGC